MVLEPVENTLTSRGTLFQIFKKEENYNENLNIEGSNIAL